MLLFGSGLTYSNPSLPHLNIQKDIKLKDAIKNNEDQDKSANTETTEISN